MRKTIALMAILALGVCVARQAPGAEVQSVAVAGTAFVATLNDGRAMHSADLVGAAHTTKRPSGSPGLSRRLHHGSVPQNVTQKLRNRLIEDVVVERVEDDFPIVFAGKKVADIAVDRRHRDVAFRGKASCGEAH